MSQNIFIDVDGTLLNSNEGVDPRAQEILRQIRLKLNAEHPDSGLYLWSGAGGDYARSKAEEHGLAGFFSGFAGKPDVIIDDNPSKMICEDAIRFLPKILKFAKNVKEVRFPKGWRYGIIPNGNKAWPDLKVYVEKELPEVWLCLQEYQISLL
ncbi:MAG TPA: hypothetical protein VK769_04560 [Verrucomicrobiae bacterium]|nr:hypothetical protein [Verrucomicrobiae bacterium]